MLKGIVRNSFEIVRGKYERKKKNLRKIEKMLKIIVFLQTYYIFDE